MEKWAASELEHAQLGDPRRKKRLIAAGRSPGRTTRRKRATSIGQ